MKRTKEDAAETARHILQTAGRMFLDNGFENVSLDDIATEAGLTRGAIHWHFNNKQGLLLALREEARRPFRELADNLPPGAGKTTLERLYEVISGIMERFENDPRKRGLIRCMIRLDLTLAESNSKCGQAFRLGMHKLYVTIFEAVERDVGLPAPWTAEKAASALHATMDGLFINWAMGGSQTRLAPDGQIYLKKLFELWKKDVAQPLPVSPRDRRDAEPL